MTTEEKRFAIKTPEYGLVVNILEISEGWAWAVFYQNQGKEYRDTPPSKVPPDWINALKERGYRCVEVFENTRTGG